MKNQEIKEQLKELKSVIDKLHVDMLRFITSVNKETKKLNNIIENLNI